MVDRLRGRGRHPRARISTAAPGREDRMIRLLVADDHPMFVSGLTALLDAEEDMSVVAVAATGEEALRAATEQAPDVAVLDVNMPGGDGLTVAAGLRAAGLPTRALILTMF